MVSTAAIVCMGISAIIAFGVPIGLFLGLRKRLGLQVVPMLVGVAVFILFALILESLLHRVVLQPQPDGTIPLRTDNPVLYVLYAAFAAGIFEETGRLAGFALLKRRFQGVRTAVSYGIGHGGVEAILLLGLAMISNIVLSLSLNSGAATEALPASAVAALTGTAPGMFLVGGVERIVAIALQLSLSVLVWVAVSSKGRWWLFPLAILLHAVADIPAASAQAGGLSLAWTEGLTAVVAIAVTAYAVWWFRRCRADERGRLDGVQQESS